MSLDRSAATTSLLSSLFPLRVRSACLCFLTLIKTAHTFLTLFRPLASSGQFSLRVRVCVCANVSMRALSCLPHRIVMFKKKKKKRSASLTPAPPSLVKPQSCGQGKMYFLMTDGSVGLQQEAWLQCFTIYLETRTERPHCSTLSASSAMGASLLVSGYKHKTEGGGGGGGEPNISGPLRPPGGVEVWRTSVLGMACVSVFSACL